MTVQVYMGDDSRSALGGKAFPPILPIPNETCPLCCDCCDCGVGVSEVGVRYVNGEVRYILDVFSSFGFGRPWGHTIAYSNKLANRWDFGNGFGWFIQQWPYIAEVEDVSTGEHYFVMVETPWVAVWFDEVTGTYTPRHGADYTFTHDTTNNVFKVTTCDGELWEFNDFDQTSYPGGLFRASRPRVGRRFR